MNIELTNPSAFHPLRIYQQARARNTFDTQTAKAPLPKRETRAELETRGGTITLVPTRVMTKTADGTLRTVTREVPTPLWKAEGAESLQEWCTGILEKIADDIRKSAAAAAPRVQRVVDTWGPSVPFASIPPHGKMNLQMSEEKRFLAECDEPVTLAIANTHPVRTIRLRTHDAKTGETKHSAIVNPAREYPHAGTVDASKQAAAVIELVPT